MVMQWQFIVILTPKKLFIRPSHNSTVVVCVRNSPKFKSLFIDKLFPTQGCQMASDVLESVGLYLCSFCEFWSLTDMVTLKCRTAKAKSWLFKYLNICVPQKITAYLIYKYLTFSWLCILRWDRTKNNMKKQNHPLNVKPGQSKSVLALKKREIMLPCSNQLCSFSTVSCSMWVCTYQCSGITHAVHLLMGVMLQLPLICSKLCMHAKIIVCV